MGDILVYQVSLYPGKVVPPDLPILPPVKTIIKQSYRVGASKITIAYFSFITKNSGTIILWQSWFITPRVWPLVPLLDNRWRCT